MGRMGGSGTGGGTGGVTYQSGAYGFGWESIVLPGAPSNGDIVIAYNTDTSATKQYSRSNGAWVNQDALPV